MKELLDAGSENEICGRREAQLREEGTAIPVTYAGGVTTMADLEKIKTAGTERVDVTVGSALDIFGGDLAYKDVVAWHHDQADSAQHESGRMSDMVQTVFHPRMSMVQTRIKNSIEDQFPLHLATFWRGDAELHLS
ncbi:hypothetical protein KSP39_PZI023863 [Platanthera zijinensis]|uniref:Phosphoribosylformimino-5-aminoimidazole carboxamide ribotide isomerase n=1 Tax=Platanthera zijinensis TaxID=2320716 RepID=A0AAP0FT15_9ASPA